MMSFFFSFVFGKGNYIYVHTCMYLYMIKCYITFSNTCPNNRFISP